MYNRIYVTNIRPGCHGRRQPVPQPGPAPSGRTRPPPPEDSGGIWAFNDYQVELDDTFDAGEVTARLAGLAEVLIPASR
jgi:hypothetical protein